MRRTVEPQNGLVWKGQRYHKFQTQLKGLLQLLIVLIVLTYASNNMIAIIVITLSFICYVKILMVVKFCSPCCNRHKLNGAKSTCANPTIIMHVFKKKKKSNPGGLCSWSGL